MSTRRYLPPAALLFAATLIFAMLAPLPAAVAAEARPFAYGITIADPSAAAGGSFDLSRRAGFSHVYAVLRWDEVEPQPGQLAWANGQANALDTLLGAARQYGLKLILRLDRPPVWAGGHPLGADAAAFGRFAGAVATRAKGVATAYEIFNEPNLPFEFGGAPDPAKYTQLLAAAYGGIKAADASAVVLSAGMAPYTGGLNGTMEDVTFLRAMYRHGAQNYFDALGIHPYGGNTPPETDPTNCGICFRRAELYRQVMLKQGDAAHQAWITEFGYLQTSNVDMGQYEWLKLAPQQQGDYIARAYGYAYQNWPWLGGAVLFNLDFSTVGWTGMRSGMYWFALLNADRSPRPAYDIVAAMPKPGSPQSPVAASAPALASPAATPTASVSAPAAITTTSTGTVCEMIGRVAVCRPANW